MYYIDYVAEISVAPHFFFFFIYGKTTTVIKKMKLEIHHGEEVALGSKGSLPSKSNNPQCLKQALLTNVQIYYLTFSHVKNKFYPKAHKTSEYPVPQMLSQLAE